MKYKVPAQSITAGNSFNEFKVLGDTFFEIRYVSSLDNCDNSCLVFFAGNEKERILSIDAGCIIASSEFFHELEGFRAKAIVLGPNPKLIFLRFLQSFLMINLQTL